MIATILFVIVMSVRISGDYENAIDTRDTDYILKYLVPYLDKNNLFDGPARVANARTKPSKNIKPPEENIMYYLLYAAAAYDPYHVKDLSCTYCERFRGDVDIVEEFSAWDVGAFLTVSFSRQEIVIAYRGTQDIWNFVLDFTFVQKDIDGCKVHLGFHLYAMSLYEKVMIKVAFYRKAYPDYKIICTGHSLGGAIARLTIFYLLKLNEFPGAAYELYTYGEPRVGNKAFADYFNVQNITSARCLSRADIMGHVPPVSLLAIASPENCYVHPQPEYWINGNESRFCDQDCYEDPNCSSSLAPLYSALDHAFYGNIHVTLGSIQNPAYSLRNPLFDMSKSLPPLPTSVSNVLGATNTLVQGLFVPLYGRK